MSGFAAINGEADGGPLLPPIALTDEVTALAAAFAIMAALHAGRRPGGGRLPPRVAAPVHGPAALGLRDDRLPPAAGRVEPALLGAPRHVALPDGRWVAVSASAETVGRRVMELIGLGGRDDLQSFGGGSRPGTRSTPTWPASAPPARSTRSWPRSRTPTPPRRPSTTWPACSPIPRWRPAGGIVEADGVPMPGVGALSRRRGRCAGPAGRSEADDPHAGAGGDGAAGRRVWASRHPSVHVGVSGPPRRAGP